LNKNYQTPVLSLKGEGLNDWRYFGTHQFGSALAQCFDYFEYTSSGVSCTLLD